MDVILKTVDSDDSSLDGVEITLNVVSYKSNGNRGITAFPLKTLKLVEWVFKVSTGAYFTSPTVLLDFGSIMRTWNVSAVLTAPKTESNPIEYVEGKAVELFEFFNTTSFLADATLLKIGAVTDSTYDPFTDSSDTEYIEGKINTYDIDWDEKTCNMVRVKFEFIQGIDLDLF